MQEKLKRFILIALAICLVCVPLVGSALALNVSHQKVSMPDPYGVMPLSLTSVTSSRTIYNSKTITYGSSNSMFRATYASQSQIGTASCTLARTSPSSIFAYKESYISVPSGTYIDFTANVSFDPTEYQSLIVSGTVVSELFSYLWPYTSATTSVAQSAKATPDTVQVLINGVPTGTIFNTSGSGFFTLSDQEFILTEAVISVGFRFTWTSADTVTSSTGSSTYYRDYSLYFKVTDNVNLTPVAVEDTDYIPYFERTISWLQSIAGNISTSNFWLEQIASSMSAMSGTDGIQAIVQSLDPTVENSQGWYTKEIADAFDTSTEGTVGNTISDIGSVYASDEDIQLKENTSDLQSAVIENFFPGTSEDGTTTSGAALDVGDVEDLSNISDSVSSWFAFDVDIGELFSSVDSGASDWFSEETANNLDTVVSAQTYDSDDDPYNMQDYYDFIDSLFAKYGGGVND